MGEVSQAFLRNLAELTRIAAATRKFTSFLDGNEYSWRYHPPENLEMQWEVRHSVSMMVMALKNRSVLIQKARQSHIIVSNFLASQNIFLPDVP